MVVGLVEQLKIPREPKTKLHIMAANGKKICHPGKCHLLPTRLRTQLYCLNLYIPLYGYDAVLEVKWLRIFSLTS